MAFEEYQPLGYLVRVSHAGAGTVGTERFERLEQALRFVEHVVWAGYRVQVRAVDVAVWTNLAVEEPLRPQPTAAPAS